MREMSVKRRRAAVLGGSAAAIAGGSSALSGAWLMSYQHGHIVMAWILGALQLLMLCTAIVLVAMAVRGMKRCR